MGCMEAVLEEKDAAEWVYRGEGAANLVLGYTGSSPAYLAKVVRIQKAPRGGPQSTAPNLVLSPNEILLWKDAKDIVESTSRETAAQLYVHNVMLPFLGSDHVDAGTRILVSRNFLEAIETNILRLRPTWRVDAAKVNTFCDSALLISDHSVFPNGILKGEPCISVEIKPKCGFLPSSRFLKEGNAVKKNVTRFRMHQFLKLHQGEISHVSKYDPLDLFSRCSGRINKAMKALFTTPQNNFRIFLNGALIFGGLGGGADGSISNGDELEDQLEGFIKADQGSRLPSFLELIAETIFKSGILDRLLETQRQDSLDIEGAIHAYYNIVSQPCKVCRDLGNCELSQKYSTLHYIPLEESLKIVRNYLIAATAKDCSLMISFRPKQSGDQESTYSSMHMESTNQSFDYKAYFIDLDMKPLKKMVYYYELDQKIVSHYIELQKIDCGASESEGLQKCCLKTE